MNENIGSHLTKEFWSRRVAEDSPERHMPRRAEYYSQSAPWLEDSAVDLYTQEDFMRENTPSAHAINSRYMSLRPVYDVREKRDAEGNVMKDENGQPMTEWYVVDFESVETVRFGLQKRINTSKAAFLASNGFWICHEDNQHDLGEKLASWKDSAGLDLAWMEFVNSCCQTADGAIYLYIYNNRLCYQVFSYLKGDILFPDVDENRNFILYRLYTLRGRRAVDIYSTTRVQTWIEGNGDADKEQSWVFRVSGWFAKNLNWGSTKVSKDGWRCVADNPVQTPDGVNPCIYLRLPDIPSGVAEQDICALEKAASFIADGVKSTSQAPLFIKATNIENLPRTDSTGKVIGVKGAVDEILAADAKFLTPPDLSNIATIDIDNKKESIKQTTMSVDITPEIFRSADPSSAAIKLLFTDTLIWCKNEFVHYYPALADLVEVFKHLVAKLEIGNGGADIASMRTSCGCDFWIPQNDTETLKRELDQVAYRVKSRKSAMSDIGNSHVEDYEQIFQEWKEELDLKARVPATATAQVEQEYGAPAEKIEVQEEDIAPQLGIDNAATGKSITE